MKRSHLPLLAALLFSLPAAGGDAPETECASAPIPAAVLAGIPNARTPEPGMVTGGVPDRQAIKAAADAGFEAVISLQTPGEPGAIEEEARVREAGLRFLRIPVAGAAGLTRDNARRLDAALTEHRNGKLIVHCASGNRVGGLFALRAGLLQNRPLEEAVAIGKAHGLTGLESRVREILEPETD